MNPDQGTVLEPAAIETSLATTPKTWVLLGDKRGDNGQVEAIVAALDWPVTRIDLTWRKPFDLEKPKVRPTLDHLDRDASDTFGPPWPDLIITVGRRPSMVAAWIKEQAQGRTKIALFGKPSGLMERFDLIIATGESQMPPMDKVAMMQMPLMRVDDNEVRREANLWRDRFSGLAHPLIAISIGGPTGPYVYDEGLGDRLLAYGMGVVEALGGTPYYVTSRRTPKALTAQLAAGLDRRAKLYTWDPANAENPYKALLGLADGFVVTGDSISMMVEIVRLKRPLKVFPLPMTLWARVDQLRRYVAVRVFAHELHGNEQAVWRRRLAQLLFKLNILHHTRDFETFRQSLISQGLATALAGPFAPPTGLVADDAGAAARRIARLMDSSTGQRRI